MKKSKRMLSLILSACLLITAIYIPYACFAEIKSGKCGRTATYEFDDTTGTLTMSGTGEVTGSQAGCTTWKNYKDSITTLIIEEGITSIYQDTFKNFTNLETVILPQSITSIGRSAFSGCTSLKNLTIPESITTIESFTFSNCGIEEIVIPDNIERLKYGCFSDCSSLKKLTIGTGLKTSDVAFIDCDNLQGVYISDLSAWSKIQFTDSVNKRVSYTNPLQYAKKLYLNDVLVTDLVIPADVETIGRGAFAYCESLKSITIPSTVKVIEDYAFFYCPNVTNFEISDGVESIGTETFCYLSGLNEIKLPKSITYIGEKAFSNEKNLTTFVVDPQNTSYTSDDGVLYNYDKTSLICYPMKKTGTTYTIPNTVKILEYNSFQSNNNLRSMVIPSNVETIETDAFSYCTKLTELIIEDGVKTLGLRSFFDTSIKNVIIPKSVEKIYGYALSTNYKTLSKAYILNPNVEIVTYSGASTINASTIYGYEGSTAQTYAENKNVPFVVICKDGTQNHTYVLTVTSPTCLEQGYTTYTCTTCGYEYKSRYVDALGHTEVFDDAVEPDCTHTGLTEGSHCSVCNEILTPQTTVDPLDHSYTKEVIAPTCSQQGYTEYTCERCGDSYKDDFTDTTAHSFTYYVGDGNATCTKDGTKTASCDRCSATDTVTDFGSMLPHTCVWRIATPATENQEGVEEYYCTVCNTVVETRAIPVLEPIEENEAPLELIEDKEIVIDATSNLTTPYDDFRVVSGLGCAKVAWSTDKSVDGYLVYTSTLPDEDFELVSTVESNEADYCVIQNLARSSIMYIRLVAYKTENDKLIQYPKTKQKRYL